jgi:WhiB family redox-sensing transcriptional regulator
LAPQILGADIDLKPRPRGVGRPACAGTDPEVFFPTQVGGTWQVYLAKRICAGCPMRELCLEEAIPYADLHGIWGGTTPRERVGLRKQRREERSIEEDVRLVTL